MPVTSFGPKPRVRGKTCFLTPGDVNCIISGSLVHSTLNHVRYVPRPLKQAPLPPFANPISDSPIPFDIDTIVCSVILAEEERLVENGGQEEEKKPIVPLKKEEDDDLPPLDSSDEEDSDEEDAYQEDGFVVADVSDEDLPDVGDDEEGGKEKRGLRRLRKGGKRKRLELDQEDLDLIAVSKGLLPSTKLKKTVADPVGLSGPDSISVAKTSSTRTFSPLSFPPLLHVLPFPPPNLPLGRGRVPQ